LFIVLQVLDLDRLGKGVKPGLNRNDVYQCVVTVPPLAEQHRIITNVDELMTLCDRLEAAQVKRENGRDRLAAASLHRLNQPADTDAPEAFREHTRFYLNHLPRLTTRPERIKPLRQTILNLAVLGRLVDQNDQDEPAESLLSSIARVRLEDPGRSKNSKVDDSDPKFVQHLPRTLPNNWFACPLGELFRFIDYRGRTPTRTDRGVRLVTAKNVRMGSVANDPIEFIDEHVYSKWMTRGYPQNGDLLFVTEGATTGYVGMIDFPFTFVLAQRTIDLQPYLPGYNRFLLLTITAVRLKFFEN
jgi:type I restriction enzyme S subunit